jgi:uncharacterized protein YbjT (DUF2867 family)
MKNGTLNADAARPVLVFGGKGRVGRLVVAELLGHGRSVRVFSRSGDPVPDPEGGAPDRAEVVTGDLGRPETLTPALDGAGAVVSCAFMEHVPTIAAACRTSGVERAVFLTSTRRFTRFPDAVARRVEVAEEAVRSAALRHTILRPAMIYGGGPDGNLWALAERIRRRRLVPMPGGGRARLQPVNARDVARAVTLALASPEAEGRELTVAGAERVTLREIADLLAERLGVRARVVSVPLPLARVGAAGLGAVGRAMGPRGRGLGEWPGRIRRLAEDRTFDIEEAERVLGWRPRGIREGLDDLIQPAAPGNVRDPLI